MQAIPITEDQESTLRRWVSRVGKRPGKRAKAFLQEEKGLSKDQIDRWFEDFANEHNPKKNVQDLEQIPESIDTGPQPFSQDIDMVMDNPNEAHQHEAALDGLDFDSFGLDYFSSDAPELQIWSPIGLSQDAMPNPMQFMFDTPEKSSLWSPSMASQGYFSRSATMSSMSELNPLLSPLSKQQDFFSMLDKSSESSMRTWDTASTLVSTTQDHTMDDMKDCEYELEEETYVASAALIRFVPPPTPKSTRLASIKEDEDFHAPLCGQSDIQPSPIVHFSSSPQHPSLPPPPTKSSTTRSPEISYKCTSCDSHFTRKGDWKRHEEGHDPPILWTCMLGETLLYSRSQWKCVFCSSLKKSHEEMKQHLMEHHRVFKCANKKPCFSRKDKLKQHLLQVHALSEGQGEGEVGWETWWKPARKKWAWGCGYCGVCLFTWEGRMIHLADHYEKQPSCVPRWSRSLVVRGLLKQARPDFNVNQVWKSLAGDLLTVDGGVEWSKESAISLKHRLEYHSGTPEQLAREAFRLAHFTKSQSRGGRWMSQASVAAIPPSISLDVEPESRSLPPKSKFAMCATSQSVTMKNVVMIQDTNFF